LANLQASGDCCGFNRPFNCTVRQAFIAPRDNCCDVLIVACNRKILGRCPAVSPPRASRRRTRLSGSPAVLR
jgi:hypothetical protein